MLRPIFNYRRRGPVLGCGRLSSGSGGFLLAPEWIPGIPQAGCGRCKRGFDSRRALCTETPDPN